MDERASSGHARPGGENGRQVRHTPGLQRGGERIRQPPSRRPSRSPTAGCTHPSCACPGAVLHASVVRLPRSVHGQGERHGFVPMLAAVAREKGVSAYVGDGENLWPSVHRLDAARVFRLALERGARNEAFHAVAEKGVRFRLIAEAIGRQIGVPAKSLTADEAGDHFGDLAMWVAGNGPAASDRTRETLGWQPAQIGLVEDIGRADYAA